MGVLGLWQLLGPAGRRVDIATLRGKTLAVDASIWMFHFLKAMRDEEGDVRKNAHILGTLSRICKLIFHRIKAVFVFDGGVPMLKKRIMEQRRRKYAQQETKMKRTAQKLLINELVLKKAKMDLKASAPGFVLPPESMRDGEQGGFVVPTEFVVPPGLAGDANGLMRINPNRSRAAAAVARRKEKIVDLVDSDEDDSYFQFVPRTMQEFSKENIAHLPLQDQMKIIAQTKQLGRQSRREDLLPVAGDPNLYSAMQLTTFLKHVRKKDELNQLQKNLDASAGGEGSRIASDRNREFILVLDKSHVKRRKKGAVEEDEMAAAVVLSASSEDEDDGHNRLISRVHTRLRGKVDLETCQTLLVECDWDEDDSVDLGAESLKKKDFVQRLYNAYDGMVDAGDCKSLLENNGWDLHSLLQELQYSNGREEAAATTTTSSSSILIANHHDALVQQMFEALDGTVDETTCRALLISNDWRLEETVATFMESQVQQDYSNASMEIARHKNDKRVSFEENPMVVTSSEQGQKEQPVVDVEWKGDKVKKNDQPASSSSTVVEGGQEEQLVDDLEWEEDDVPSSPPPPSSPSPPASSQSEKRGIVLADFNHRSDGSLIVSFKPSDITPESLALFTEKDFESRRPASPSDTRPLHTPKPPAQEAVIDLADDDSPESVKQPQAEQIVLDLDFSGEASGDEGEYDVSGDYGASGEYDSSPRVSPFRSKRENTPMDSPSVIDPEQALQRALKISSNLTNWASAEVKRALTASGSAVNSSMGPPPPPMPPPLTPSKRESMAGKTEIEASATQSKLRSPQRGQTLADLERENETLRVDRKKAARDADQVTPEMREDLIELLGLFGLPVVESPMEAEAQCAALELSGYVDGIVTDDSDAFLFGGRRVYRNIFADNKKDVEEYRMDEIEHTMGLDREKCIQLALMMGSDYTEGVTGIGMVNALEVLGAFPEPDGLKKFKAWVDAVVDDDIAEAAAGRDEPSPSKRKKSKVNFGIEPDDSELTQKFKKSHANARRKWVLQTEFPEARVVDAYNNPNVTRYSLQQLDSTMRPREPDVDGLRRFCLDRLGMESDKFDRQVLKPLQEYMSIGPVQTSMDSFIVRYEDQNRFSGVRSKRLAHAINGLRSDDVHEDVVAVDEFGNVVSLEERTGGVESKKSKKKTSMPENKTTPKKKSASKNKEKDAAAAVAAPLGGKKSLSAVAAVARARARRRRLVLDDSDSEEEESSSNSSSSSDRVKFVSSSSSARVVDDKE